MHTIDFNLNRPVHTARRDACFERALDLLSNPSQELDTPARLQHVNRILSLLQTAEHHGNFAVKSPRVSTQEKDFLHFLRLIVHNVQSAQAMIQHQGYFEGEEGFLCQFLGVSPQECALPAMHYRRRADDIFQGLWHLLTHARRPYMQLRQATEASLNPDELQRYRRARESALAEMDKPHAGV